MASRIEIEDSYILEDGYNVYEKLEKNGFAFESQIVEEDTYYTDKEETFIKDKVCLRTRKTNDELLELTYKPKTDDNTEKYGKREVNIELNVKDYDDIRFVICQLGYIEYVSFKKFREIYSKNIDGIEYSVMIDKIDGVGGFIELELLADTEEEKEKLKIKLDEFVEMFECNNLKEKTLPYRDIVKNSKK